jgi:hypothetical protein
VEYVYILFVLVHGLSFDDNFIQVIPWLYLPSAKSLILLN